jgi:hypothetical protein
MNNRWDYPLYGSPYDAPNSGRPETVADKMAREAKDPAKVAADRAAQGQVGKPSNTGGNR